MKVRVVLAGLILLILSLAVSCGTSVVDRPDPQSSMHAGDAYSPSPQSEAAVGPGEPMIVGTGFNPDGPPIDASDEDRE